MTDFELYNLNESNGWIIGSEFDKKTPFYSSLLQLGRTNYLEPWKDSKFHYHTKSIEIYLVLHGELWVIVDDCAVKLKERSILLVRPGVFHSVIGGKGKIQHFGMKIPSKGDKKVFKKNDDKYEEEIESIVKSGFNQNPYHQLNPNHGFIADLKENHIKNRWLFGFGDVNYNTKDFCFAFVSLKNKAEKDALKHPDHLHYHAQSTEWYLSLKNSQEMLIKNKKLIVPEGYLLKIPNNVAHKQLSFEYPFEGVTIRTPILDDKFIINPK